MSNRPEERAQHVTRLEVENVMRVKAARILPGGNPLVIIGGRNAQGKTSVLQSLAMAFGGRRALPETPVRLGAESGTVVAETEDYTVTLTLKPDGGSELIVKAKDGIRMGSPQTLLDRMCGDFTFDPVAFLRLPTRAQVDALKTLIGLDFAEVDAQVERLFAMRTQTGRDRDTLNARFTSMPLPPETLPEAEVSVADLVNTLKAGQANNAANALEREQLTAVEESVTGHQGMVDHLNGLLEEARRRVTELEEQVKTKQTFVASSTRFRNEVAARVAKLKDVDTTDVEAAINAAEDLNRQIRGAQSRRELRDAHEAKKAEYAELTRQLDEQEKWKRQQIEQAAFPVPGLSFDGDKVLFNGVPMSQSSGAEQLRVSVAMAAARNPQLKVMLVKDGSLLDDDNLKQLAGLAEEYGVQVWVERVGHGDEVAVVLEDGEIIENRLPDQAGETD